MLFYLVGHVLYSQNLDVSRAEDYRLIHPLLSDTSKNLHFGGEIRLMAQLFNNYNFTQKNQGYPDQEFTRMYHRIFLYTDWNYRGKLRLFGQILSTDKWIKNTPLLNDIEKNDLSFHQLFAEWKVDSNSLLRLGKQELYFDSERMLGVRELPNNRRTNLGLNYFYFLPQKKVINLFYFRPIQQNFYALDDEVTRDYVAGINLNNPKFKPFTSYNLLLTFSNQENIELLNGGGNDKRVSLDFHLKGKKNRLDYSLETVYQFGKLGTMPVSAAMALADFSIDLNSKWKFHYEFHWASGDRNPKDNRINTFNTLYSRPFFGQSLPFNIANIFSNGIGFMVNMSNRQQLNFTYHHLQIIHLKDAIYSPSMKINQTTKDIYVKPSSNNLTDALFINYSLKLSSNILTIVNVTYSKPNTYFNNLGMNEFQSFYNFRLINRF